MNIRNCISEDLPSVHHLMKELSTHSDTKPPKMEDIRETFEAMSAMPDMYRNFVVQEEGRTVAFLSIVIYRTMLHPTGTALINELVVASDYRRRGIAGALVERAMVFAKDAGAVEIEVGTEIGNERARRFYKNAGFNKEFLLFNRDIKS